MAQKSEAMPKTGEFHAQVGMREEDPGEVRSYNRRLLLGGMASQVAGATVDNREYELVARIGKWKPVDEFGLVVEKLRLDFTLVLLDPLVAEVGEWVKDLPERVSDDKRNVILGEGHGDAKGWVFQRGRPGWRRIE